MTPSMLLGLVLVAMPREADAAPPRSLQQACATGPTGVEYCPEDTPSCAVVGNFKYLPFDLPGTSRSVEASANACQQRCASSPGARERL